jgi:streptogramin lyase
MAATPDGLIWLADASEEVLRRLDTTAGAVDTFPLVGKFPAAPMDIAVDEAGDICSAAGTASLILVSR